MKLIYGKWYINEIYTFLFVIKYLNNAIQLHIIKMNWYFIIGGEV